MICTFTDRVSVTVSETTLTIRARATPAANIFMGTSYLLSRGC